MRSGRALNAHGSLPQAPPNHVSRRVLALSVAMLVLRFYFWFGHPVAGLLGQSPLNSIVVVSISSRRGRGNVVIPQGSTLCHFHAAPTKSKLPNSPSAGITYGRSGVNWVMSVFLRRCAAVLVRFVLSRQRPLPPTLARCSHALLLTSRQMAASSS